MTFSRRVAGASANCTSQVSPTARTVIVSLQESAQDKEMALRSDRTGAVPKKWLQETWGLTSE